MKKHILGLGVFGFIFASFAFSFAFFYAPPIPQIGEVREPIEIRLSDKKYEKTSCFRKKTKDITSSVVSSQLYLEDQKIISEIKLSWNGAGNPPKIVIVTTNFFTLKNQDELSFETFNIFIDPFKDSMEKTFTVVSNIPGSRKIGKQNNFYVISSASDYDSDGEKIEVNKGLDQATQVLFVHGSDSVIR